MIIQRLHDLYGRLAEEGSRSGDVAPAGFSVQQVSFVVELDADGSLVQIQEWTEDRKARRMIVPGETKPSGSGLNPCFLWDNPGYLLGLTLDEKKADAKKIERTLKSFEEFRNRHVEVAGQINDPGFAAVCKFLRDWCPDRGWIADLPDHVRTAIASLVPGNGTFRIRGEREFVHEKPLVRQWWMARPDKKKWWVAEAQTAKGNQAMGQCAVTGAAGMPIARLHEPKIKGVAGTNMSGASLVSFNAAAYDSYGLEQSLNASISESAAFAYCNALNRLLSRGSRQKMNIGGSTYVFWTDRPTLLENSICDLLGGPPLTSPDTDLGIAESGDSEHSDAEDDAPAGPAQSTAVISDVRDVLRKIRDGKPVTTLGEPAIGFYVLGLSPNAGRIAVRYWGESTIGELLERLSWHLRDIEITGARENREFPTIRILVAQAAREPKDVPDLLAGALVRSVVEGLPYPMGLFAAYVRRIRADRVIDSVRAGFLKGTLNRQLRFGIRHISQELPMSLDPLRPEPAYQMGRLFAALERNQSDSLGRDLNASIKDRYFGAASATPAAVFPRLIRLTQHHLSALEGGRRVNAEKRMQEIMARLDSFPPHLTLAEQGLFAIGYYHQVQAFFTPRETEAIADPA